MNIHITEGRLPPTSAVATPDQIEAHANYAWNRLYPAIRDVRAAITNLDECLHSSGVEDAATLLDEMMQSLMTLCDHIEAQKAIQIEYRRGDR